MSQPTPNAIGIDVAKATLSVCLLFPDGMKSALDIRNTEADIIGKLIPQLAGYTGKIVMEATSYYHWLVALALSKQGFDVRVVNPLLAKKYTHASVRQVKTDPADAAGLAQCALLEPKLPTSFQATKKQLALRKKIGFIASLTRQIQSLRASVNSLIEAKEICGMPLSEAEQQIQQSIVQLKKQLRTLEDEVVTALAPATQPRLNRLTTVPGISPIAAALLLHLCTDSKLTAAKSWVAFAGLDVSVRESGTWRGQTRLTKRGHPYLRRRLYGAAWGAVMNNKSFKAYYDHLRNRGRQHTEALTIIARKLVRISHALLKNETVFDAKLPLFIPDVEKSC